MRYTVILDPDVEEGGYTVTVPLLPGCITEGDTFEEAVANARDAIATHVESLAYCGDQIPLEDPGLLAISVEADAELDQRVTA